MDLDPLAITQITNYPITENGPKNIPIPDGYDAVDSINLNVNVPTPAPILQNVSINENGTYFPSEGYDGINMVMVDVPTTISIDLDNTYVSKNVNYKRNNQYSYPVIGWNYPTSDNHTSHDIVVPSYDILIRVNTIKYENYNTIDVAINGTSSNKTMKYYEDEYYTVVSYNTISNTIHFCVSNDNDDLGEFVMSDNLYSDDYPNSLFLSKSRYRIFT